MPRLPIVYFRNRYIYKITPRIAVNGLRQPYIIQWIGPDQMIDFNNKEEITGKKIMVKYQFISDAIHSHSQLLGNNHNMVISLNNIGNVEETELIIGNTYTVVTPEEGRPRSGLVTPERKLVLRGFINSEFYVSEDPYTNNYETFHNIPVDEKKQIFRIPINALIF